MGRPVTDRYRRDGHGRPICPNCGEVFEDDNAFARHGLGDVCSLDGFVREGRLWRATRDHDITDDPRYMTAVHEAGHAVIAERLGLTVIRASIIPKGDSLGRVHLDNVRVPSDEWRLEPGVEPKHVRGGVHDFLAMSMAGREDEIYFLRLPPEDPFEPVDSCARFDDERQAAWLETLKRDDFGFRGQIPAGWPRWLQGAPPGTLKKYLLGEARSLARKMVPDDWDIVQRLAHALLDRPEMSGDEIREVVRAAAGS